MRASTPPANSLVGTDKGRLTALEQPMLRRDWQHARPSVSVKLLPHEGEAYVFAESKDSVKRERSMRLPTSNHWSREEGGRTGCALRDP
jgi:hypothetical protein